MDGINGSQGRMQMNDAQQTIHHHAHYMQEHDHHMLHHMSNENGMEHDDNIGNGGGSESLEGEVAPDPGNMSDNQTALVARANCENNNSSLSLSRVRFTCLTPSHLKRLFHSLML
ncbi:unnamed protein product [Thlaspi arvense]|uniref:Uncharacterized protein n=1 Tax=Thlaspi arvense TaxID=13288 RepID=A0AAU9RWL6_THLAR|nr:unnamed protein product [Thlaspi arvense]